MNVQLTCFVEDTLTRVLLLDIRSIHTYEDIGRGSLGMRTEKEIDVPDNRNIVQ